MRHVATGIAVLLLSAACAIEPEPSEPITWSADWFACDGHFQCIVVYDAFCNFTSVNAEFARTYEFWAHQEVRRLDEKVPCRPPGQLPVPNAVCRKEQCDLF